MLSKRLYRSERDRMVGGVAAGIAEYLGWDPTLVRLLWALAFIPGGIPGLLPYLLCWIIIPTESRVRELNRQEQDEQRPSSAPAATL